MSTNKSLIGLVASGAAAIAAITFVACATPTPAHADVCNWVPGLYGATILVCDPSPSGTATTKPDLFAAVAVSESTLASGDAWRSTTRVQAERTALAGCRKMAADCKVVDWVQNQCIALAKSMNDHMWGVDGGEDRRTASANALNQCRSGGGMNCVVVINPCSDD